MLAAYKPLFTGTKINYNFGKNFEAWFNDRFWGRNIVINNYGLFSSLINTKKEAERVFEGEEGWLFYKGGNSTGNFQNKTLFSQNCLEKVKRYLLGVQTLAANQNIKFYFMIAPDKNKIYGEYYRYYRKLRPDSESRANQLINYLRQTTNLAIIYPYHLLHEHKKDALLYYKKDTHWNNMGAYWGYRALLDSIKKDFPDIKIFSAGEREKSSANNDLKNMFVPYLRSNDQSEYWRPKINSVYKCRNVPGKDNREICESSEGNLSLVVYRDSFTTALRPYLMSSFKQATLLKKYQIHKKELEEYKPNVLVLEVVERNLPALCSLKILEP